MQKMRSKITELLKKYSLFRNKKIRTRLFTVLIVLICVAGIGAASQMDPQGLMQSSGNTGENSKQEMQKETSRNDDGPSDSDQGAEAEDIVLNEQDTDSSAETVTKSDGQMPQSEESLSRPGAGTESATHQESESGAQSTPPQSEGTTGGTAGSGAQQEGGGQNAPEKTEITCYIEIRCDSVSGNGILTANGYANAEVYAENSRIIQKTQMRVKNGATVYDVLSRACAERGIALDAPKGSYGTNYVKGINQLYEFMGGGNSGWVYLVNGKSPNVGCSGYQLSDGDEIVWKYVVR